MSEGIRVAGRVNDSITDGPGLRYTLFVQGCPRRCEGCHNPQALPFEGGTLMTAEEVFAEIGKNPLLSGVTFSGGEPFCQAAALLPLAQYVKAAGLELAAYTGYCWEELTALPDPAVRQLLELCDVLIDGPFVLAQRNLDLRFRGSANQRILNCRASLAAGAPVWETSPRWVG